MNQIDANLLLALAPNGKASLINSLAPAMQVKLGFGGINTPLRVAHFLGQTVYESGYLARLSENLNYSATRIAEVFPAFADRADELEGNPIALANAVYANRYGNGDEASGDGYKFSGRGLLQLTFRDNYAALGYEDTPETVATAYGAVESAIKYWTMRKVNAAADLDDTAKVTRLVQGGSSGLAERKKIKDHALSLLGGT